ncbi:hypothetical protein C8R46DRAFT_1120411 [Mycena filopes]|nr:hypothetical protein C8R46DRAFT_1120411 [Mycena filopes]
MTCGLHAACGGSVHIICLRDTGKPSVNMNEGFPRPRRPPRFPWSHRGIESRDIYRTHLYLKTDPTDFLSQTLSFLLFTILLRVFAFRVALQTLPRRVARAAHAPIQNSLAAAHRGLAIARITTHLHIRRAALLDFNDAILCSAPSAGVLILRQEHMELMIKPTQHSA